MLAGKAEDCLIIYQAVFLCIYVERAKEKTTGDKPMVFSRGGRI
jgi:hypothetical protein